MQKVNRCLFAFDFDHTILESNSDYVIDHLFPGNKKPTDLVMNKHECWTVFMQRKFNRMNELGISSKQILEYLDRQPLTDGFKQLFERIRNHERIIISDSNTQFIETILNTNEIKVDAVFTNHSWTDDNGIQIKQHHQHGCQICPDNLCKQQVLKQYIDGKQYDRIVYVGDGGNDYCPLLCLKQSDVVFVRKGYRLEQIVDRNREKLDCNVCIFEDGSQIIGRLQELEII